MINISKQYIKNVVINNQKLFYDLIDLTDLKTKWKKENFLKIEIKKSFIRGVLRYSAEGTKLTNLISEEVKLNKKIKEFNYFTRIYPMIHLSEDLSEESQLHYDQDADNELITCWLSITENDYSPISFLKFKSKYFKKVFSKIRFPKMLIKSIKPKIGELNFWDGYILHKGNFNYSKKISCAFQMKFTKKKYEHELSIKKNDQFFIENSNEKNSIYYDNLINLTSRIDQINFENGFNEQFLQIIEIIKSLFYKENPQVSFALSVLAQRLKVNGKKFNIQNFLYKSYLYDMCSILLGCENFISYERMSKFAKKNNFNLISFLKNNDFLKIIPNNIYLLKNLSNSNYE